jgi:hypothetical protein
MILDELCRRLGTEIGLKNSGDAAQRQTLEDLINDAAEELYTQTDLPRSLLEETFSPDTTDVVRRVTLPQRVGEIRAIRDNYSAVTLHDMRPRYNNMPWPKGNMYTFRIMRDVPIFRSIDNAVGLYMPPLEGDPTSLSVNIVGATATASEVHASFDGAGAGTAVGVLWTDIFEITKDAITPTDVVLYSGTSAGPEMARIPAYGDRSIYIEVDLLETPYTCACAPVYFPYRCLDILYKPPFRPLLDATSSFQVAGYDHAIIYTAVKIYRIRGLGAQATDAEIAAAKVHEERANKVMKDTIKSKIQSEDLVIKFGPARQDSRMLRGLRRLKYGWNRSYNY